MKLYIVKKADANYPGLAYKAYFEKKLKALKQIGDFKRISFHPEVYDCSAIFESPDKTQRIVVRSTGDWQNYKWGEEIKDAVVQVTYGKSNYPKAPIVIAQKTVPLDANVVKSTAVQMINKG